MVKAGKTVRTHLWGILNAVVLGATNAISESKNSKADWMKYSSYGVPFGLPAPDTDPDSATRSSR